MFLMNSFKVSSIQANALKGLHLQTIMEDFYRSIKQLRKEIICIWQVIYKN